MPQNQHYVPQSLLRRFCAEDGHLHVYDKWERTVFRTSPRNVAAEKGFYDVEAPDGSHVSLEGTLSRWEGQAAIAVDRLLERQELGSLPKDDRVILSKFAAVQFVRGRGFREQFKDMSQQLVDHIRKQAPSREAAESVFPPADENAAKVMSLKMILDSVREFAPLLHSKAWLLFEAAPGRQYWISDSPVTPHNSVPPPSPFMGNLGLAVRGIEVYLPLSPNFTLGFFCPSLAEQVLDGHKKATALRQLTEADIPTAERIGYLADAIRYGHAVPALAQNMDFGNSLQAANAERFIFSSTPSFDIAQRMLDDNPDLAAGPRFGVQ